MLPRSACKNLAIALQWCFRSCVEITVLGPLEVRLDGRVVALGGPKPRALLAMLALHGNEVVSRDRLIEALWGDRPPVSVDQSLDTYVSRLRRALGKERLSRRAGGYVLSVGPNELDLYRFEALVQEARRASVAGDVRQAARLLSEALALWSGPALTDVLYEPFASGEAARLEEKRLVAREDLFDAQLAMGAGAELVAELERLAVEQPLRERLLGQLMLALYRAGRHAEALAVLQAARHRLADELGLEPGPQLRELERRILQHDQRLDVRYPRGRAIGRGRRRALAVVAVLAATAATAAGIILATSAGNEPLHLDDVSNRLLSVGAHSGRVGTAIDLAGSPAAVAFGAGSVWVADPGRQIVERIDPASGAVADRIAVGGEPGSIVWGGGAVWVASTLGGSIKRIDPATDTVTQAVGMGGASAAAMAFGVGGLWVADATDRALVEIDPASGSVRRTLTLDLSPSAIAVGPRAIWVAGSDAGKVEEIDVTSGETLGAVSVGQGPSALVIDDHAVWVANSLDATLSRIDAATGSVVATIAVGSGPSAIAASAGSIWVANTYSASVSRIDPKANKIVETIRVGGRPGSIAPGRGNVWIASALQGDTHRGGTLTLLTKGPFPSIDPAFQESTAALTRLAYDTLVTFEASPGPAGLRLVPDIALAVPTPTGSGTTYAFRLRPGIRYSNGRPVRAGDFRRAIERLFRLDSPGASFYTSLAGSASCVRRRAHCSLSRGIVIDEAARAVVFHLRIPDPGFLFKLTLGFAAPIPPITDRGRDSRAVPGTGPYRIVDSNAHELRLVRNRFFREWSHAAQPDGTPDRIIWRFGLSPSAQVQAIEHGRADWTADSIPPSVLRALRIRAPAQLRENPTFDVQYVPLNTRLPPFDDVRVRQALNYAVDRSKIARMYGSTSGAKPICQPMPAGFAGYRRYCPYTLRPRSDGRWSAPNVRRAKRLVTASGTRGLRIDIWAATDLPDVSAQLPTYIGLVLRRLGYRTKLHLVPYAAFSPTMRRGIQLTVDGDWVPDYPSPSSYLPSFFGCNGGHNRKRYVCDRQIDRQMKQASALEIESPSQAARLWTRIDHELVDEAVWVPTVNVPETEFVSARLQNYQYQPVWGFLVDQAWLR
jgi:peptide/nickel transport system substrate-binding protein